MEITGQDIVAAILVGGFFAAFLVPSMMGRFRKGPEQTPEKKED